MYKQQTVPYLVCFFSGNTNREKICLRTFKAKCFLFSLICVPVRLLRGYEQHSDGR
uniref:Uncharacterized protein n=1 Tax=Anguilla anguilla TaxID=7936 RepID=A0A0E9RV37_ANGAN